LIDKEKTNNDEDHQQTNNSCGDWKQKPGENRDRNQLGTRVSEIKQEVTLTEGIQVK